jgi:hypothetical protein
VTAVVTALAATLALLLAGAPAQVQVVAGEVETAMAQESREGTTTPQSSKNGDKDDGGVPIWAGIGLILLAAAAGSLAARARNRRRMREFSDE